MRRASIALLVVMAVLSPSAFATTSDRFSETLVGWSEDGELYAVVHARSRESPARLEIRKRAAKPGAKDVSVASFADGSPGVPEATDKEDGVARIDIEKWEPIKKYKLKRIEAKSRDRFKAELELSELGQRSSKFRCKNGGWSLKRKGGKPFAEHKAKGTVCYQPLGGYVHANGKRALVKLAETWDTDTSDPDVASYSDSETTFFVLVELPPK